MRWYDRLIGFLFGGSFSSLKCSYNGSILIQGLLNGYSWNMISALQAQADFETAHGVSNQLLQGNNVFGMRCVQQRKTTQISCSTYGNNGEFGGYKSIWSSVKDRIYWDKYAFGGQYFSYRSDDDPTDYFEAIADRYFPASENTQSDYTSYIENNYFSKLKINRNALIKIGALLLPFGFLIYVIIKKII